MALIDNLDDEPRNQSNKFKIEEIKKWREVHGCPIIRDDYDTEKELDNDWEAFLQCPQNVRFMADDQCIDLYGMRNEELYYTMKKKFLRTDDKDKSYTMNYDGEIKLSNLEVDDHIKRMKANREKEEDTSTTDPRQELINQEIVREKQPLDPTYDGLKNEYLYTDNRKRIIQNMNKETEAWYSGKKNVDTYYGRSIKEEVNPSIEQLYLNDPNYVVIPRHVKDEKTLKDKYYQYASMQKDKRIKADDMSTEIYGIDNTTNYNNQLKEFLKKDIDTPEIMDFYDGGSNYQEAMSQVISRCDSLMESMIYASMMINHKAKNLGEEIETKITIGKLLEQLESTSPYYADSIPCLTPMEVDDLGKIFNEESLIETKELYNNYKARFIGLKPVMENFYSKWNSTVNELCNKLEADNTNEKCKQSLLELGWNPAYQFNVYTKKDASKRIEELVNPNIWYNFIPVNNLPVYGKIQEEDNSVIDIPFSGLYILFTYNETDKIKPNVGVTTDYSDNEFYPIIRGDIRSKISINEFDGTNMEVYFVPLDLSLATTVHQYLEKNANLEMNSQFSYLKNLCKVLRRNKFQIANDKLFASYIINKIINGALQTEDDGLFSNYPLTDYTKRKNVYILYQGEKNNNISLDRAMKKIYLVDSIKLNDKLSEEYKEFASYFNITPLTENDFCNLNKISVINYNSENVEIL